MQNWIPALLLGLIGCLAAMAPTSASATAQDAPVQRLPPPDPNQPPPPTPVPAPQEPSRFTMEQAETLLVQADAGGYFDAVTQPNGSVVLRHRASGMTCRFMPSGENTVRVFEPGKRNSAAGCRSGPFPVSAYAAISGHMPLDPAIEGSLDAFRSRYPSAETFQPSGQIWPSSSRRQRFAHLISQHEGETSVFHTGAILLDGWTVIYTNEYSFRSDTGGPGGLVGVMMELAAAAELSVFAADFDEQSEHGR